MGIMYVRHFSMEDIMLFFVLSMLFACGEKEEADTATAEEVIDTATEEVPEDTSTEDTAE